MAEREKLIIPYPVIVEGKYDRLRLLGIIEGNIYTTDGFGIFTKNEKLTVMRRLAEKTPVIVLTDSDGAGKQIRSHITSAIPQDRLIQLYIPQIKGKEKRKSEPSKAGTLGVEGMETELLRSILAPYAVKDGENETDAYKNSLANPLSKADFYEAGLSGGEGSAEKRDKFAEKLGLPRGMTANSLLAAAKLLLTYDEYKKMIKEVFC